MGMTTKFYVDAAGNYLGGYAGVEPPLGAVEVPTAPDRADRKWTGTDWAVLTPEELRAAMPPLTPRQLRLTLLSIGITEAQVDAKLVNDPAGQIEWKYATYFKRNHPLVDGLGIGFSITPEQTDSLWAYAQDL
jgi:hypothetical protein